MRLKSERFRTFVPSKMHLVCTGTRKATSATAAPRMKKQLMLMSLLLVSTIIVESGASTLQAPRFMTPPSTSGSVVAEGRTKILQCQALGYPQPEYRWMKDGSFLSEFSSEHFYKIQSVTRKDAGKYKCYARNSVGTIVSEDITLTVAYMSAFPSEDPGVKTELEVLSGHAAVFDFPTLSSAPSPSVSWQAEDNALLYGAKYAVTGDNKLVILSVEESDGKKYRARATNTQLGQEETSAYITLKVTSDSDSSNVGVAPSIVVAPPAEGVTVAKGAPLAELHCVGNARPLSDLETVWLKDGKPIEEAGIAFSFNDLWNRTLSLLGADQAHAGVYTCSVGLRNSPSIPTITRDTEVRIVEKPYFSTPLPLTTTGEFGRAITLECPVLGSPAPTVTWSRNGVPLSETPNLRFREDSNNSSNNNNSSSSNNNNNGNSLQINFLRLEDSGMFQCTAQNEAGDAVAYTWLRVKTSSPVMVNPPQNMTALDGKDATIPCSAEGAPTPNVTWFLNDNQINFGGRLQILEDGSLLLSKVRGNTDSGKYTCLRSNEAGSVKADAWISVMVRTQIVQPPVDSKVILGHVASLACKVSADGNVPFEVVWHHDGTVINKMSNRFEVDETGTLRISESRASDAGEYTCEVKSAGGNDRHSAKLDVIELPYAPTHVFAEKSNLAKTVNVSWTPGFDGNSPVIKYILQFHHVPQTGPIPKDDLNWLTVMANISASSRSVLLSHLRSSAAYVFRVSAVNSVGEGPQSAPSDRVVLPQEPPSGPPLGLVGSARSESEIMIQWQPPAEDAQNGDIVGYVVRYRLFGYNDSPWSFRNVTKPLQRTYLITELITWKDYEIEIAAYNSKGVGSYSSPPIKVKTREGVPGAPPTEVRVQAVESTAVRVWWFPPDPQKINGINQGYKLQAWRGEVVAATVSVPPNVLNPLSEQTSLIDGLTPWTAYNVTVLCFTSPGDGVRSSPEIVRTHQDYPGAVGALRFEEITDRGLRVLWNPPEHPNGIILGYTLRYMVKETSHTLVEKNLTSETTDFSLNNLKPTTHYTFEVYALTEVGRGKASVATIQSGVEPVLPSPPTRLAVSNIEPFSVLLQFTPGFDGNSSVTKWTVQALSARNATWTTVYTASTEADSKAILVKNLLPYTEYQLRLLANNVVGQSEPSESTRQFQTIQAPPKHPPLNVTIRAMSATELRVRWIPLSQGEWFGIPRGYNISYRILDDPTSVEQHTLAIEDPTKNSFVVDGLEEFTLYELVLHSYNDLGSSEPSPVVNARTREAAPGEGPSEVAISATSSTTLLVKWGEVEKRHRNGIIEGYKVYYGAKGVPFRYKTVEGNATRQTTLTELKKFTKYSVQVLAYTRVGDGYLSSPPLQERTHEDVPGPPSNVSFPDVSFTTARVIWDVPSEPNGEIIRYRVSYRLQSQDASQKNFTREFLPTDRTFRAVNLEAMANYEFEVTARTNLGWGYASRGLVFTTNNREAPAPPSAPQISSSQVQDREITFSWNPGSDGYAPFRHYVVQYSENGGGWQTVPNLVDPAQNTYTVTRLKPFTTYKFRLQAVNDIGPSGWSQESNNTKTLPAAPAIPVENLKVTPITRTNVKVEWSPLLAEDFNGDSNSGGYTIEFRELADYLLQSSSPRVELRGWDKSSAVLQDLAIGKNYEIVVRAYNGQGLGPPSRPVPVYVGEAVPTGAPRKLEAQAVSPTEVRLNWNPPEADRQNGDLLGYKIFYSVVGKAAKSEEIEVVSAFHTSHSLIFLDMYTNYTISILAFNPAGEGPRSEETVTVRTLQGVPGPPANLRFNEITMNTLKVSWDPPEKPNGEILGYIVAYETAEQDENYSKQVKQRVSEQFLFVHNLEEAVTYTVSVRAQTIDYGPAAMGNVTTGPQAGSPGRPRDLLLAKTISAVKLTWTNGNSGRGPILGYYVESRRKDEDKWKTETKTEGGAIQEYLISYQNLVPTTSYTFRVIAYNKYGISLPAKSSDAITTPSKRYLEFGSLHTKPFYREPWFLVSLAAASIVIIITIVAVLCVKSKSYKYKDQVKQQRLDETSMAQTDDQLPSSTNHYATFEMRQSRRGTLKSQRTINNSSTLRSTVSRKSTNGNGNNSNNFAMVSGLRQPPRPAPSLVRYSDEDDSAKGYDENPDDSDSLTEKPSEISSTDSQGTESEQDTNPNDPHSASLVNHYANVTNTFRLNTWKRQKSSVATAVQPPSRPGGAAAAVSSNTLRRQQQQQQQQQHHGGNNGILNNTGGSGGGGGGGGNNNPRGYSSFTDSDHGDASSAVVSLNGTQIVMNNMARSRAPLPGFSSFV